MYAMRKARNTSRWQAPAEPTAYYDKRFDSHALKILPGEYIVADRDVMLVTVLGSCVSACIRDPLARVGGMNHFMLPETESEGAASETARYGAYAMEVLINELIKAGAARSRLEVKVFGGAAVLSGMRVSNVGERNARWVLRYLEAEGFAVQAQDLFGTHPRRVHYFPMTGRALVKELPLTGEPEVLASELLYRSRLRDTPTQGSVELF
ncbi:chemoreceptor glutamine deamidase CheD [Fontimonas sp. SYSU GA230001]|uniref:chemoreceptor glutamine deamidase CheD n=1 Tax=Fontimonas sp. SYSU GA230001 TaxID=3142450 RepID=UPI0032B4B0FE